MKDMTDILSNKYVKVVLASIMIVIVTLPLLLNINPKKGNKKLAKNKEETFAHTEDGIIKEEEYEGLKITNITMITKDGYTTFSADVTNTKEEPTDFENINIELKDEKGNTVITLLGNIGKGLKKNETRTITASAKGEYKAVTAKAITAYQD